MGLYLSLSPSLFLKIHSKQDDKTEKTEIISWAENCRKILFLLKLFVHVCSDMIYWFIVHLVISISWLGLCLQEPCCFFFPWIQMVLQNWQGFSTLVQQALPVFLNISVFIDVNHWLKFRLVSLKRPLSLGYYFYVCWSFNLIYSSKNWSKLGIVLHFLSMEIPHLAATVPLNV